MSEVYISILLIIRFSAYVFLLVCGEEDGISAGVSHIWGGGTVIIPPPQQLTV